MYTQKPLRITDSFNNLLFSFTISSVDGIASSEKKVILPVRPGRITFYEYF